MTLSTLCIGKNRNETVLDRESHVMMMIRPNSKSMEPFVTPAYRGIQPFYNFTDRMGLVFLRKDMSRIFGLFPSYRLLLSPVECMAKHYRYSTIGSRQRNSPFIRGTLPLHGKGVAVGQFAEVSYLVQRE